MRTWIIRVSWLALAVSVPLYIGLMIADFRYFSAPLVPAHLLALGLFYLPWWLGWLPLFGCWLMVRAWNVGGGRWGWRWACGGVLVVSHVYFFGCGLYDYGFGVLSPTISDRYPLMTPYGYQAELLVILALIPVGLLTRAGHFAARAAP